MNEVSLKDKIDELRNIIKELEKEKEQLKADYQVLRATNISLNDLVNSCQQKIRDYKIIIDKAIEYIEENKYSLDLASYRLTLIKILRGNKDEN